MFAATTCFSQCHLQICKSTILVTFFTLTSVTVNSTQVLFLMLLFRTKQVLIIFHRSSTLIFTPQNSIPYSLYINERSFDIGETCSLSIRTHWNIEQGTKSHYSHVPAILVSWCLDFRLFKTYPINTTELKREQLLFFCNTFLGGGVSHHECLHFNFII